MRRCWLRSDRSERCWGGEVQALQLFEGMEQKRFIAVLEEALRQL
jgi:hypothetical protein